jgi:hypothetical protein
MCVCCMLSILADIIFTRIRLFHICFPLLILYLVELQLLYFIYFQVHNWTVEQTAEWLATSVELPQYVPNFMQHRVTGATLPTLVLLP